MHWQRNDESCAFAQMTFGGDGSVMAVGDTAADGQADAGAFIFTASVKALEYSEHFFEIFLFEADAVVLNSDFAMLFSRERTERPRANLDHRLSALRLKFQGVAEQVQQKLVHLHRIRFDGRQVAYFDLCSRFFDANFQIAQHALGDGPEIHGNEGFRSSDNARKGEQIVDQC